MHIHTQVYTTYTYTYTVLYSTLLYIIYKTYILYTNLLGGLLGSRHRILYSTIAEVDHHRVSVAVDHLLYDGGRERCIYERCIGAECMVYSEVCECIMYRYIEYIEVYRSEYIALERYVLTVNMIYYS